MRILLALLLLGLAACDADRPVHTDFDPGADFGQYRTYRVSDPGSGPGSTTAAPNPRVVEAITSTLREELGAKGMREDPEADLEVALTIATAEETAVDQWGYQWRAEGGGPVDDEYRVEAGTLVVNFFDTGTGQLVWRSWAHGAVSRTGDPEFELLERLVRDMLREYPPRPGQE